MYMYYDYTALQLFVVRLFSAHYKFTSRKCIQTIPHWSLFAIFVGSHAAPKIHSGDILCHTRGRFSTIAPFAIIKLTRSRVSTVSVRYGICGILVSSGTAFVECMRCRLSLVLFQAICLQFMVLMKVARRFCSVRCVAFRLKSEINSRYVWLADRSPG